MGVPVKPLGFQVYEVAPTALNVAELPIHIIDGLLVAVNVGFGFTVKLLVVKACDKHPAALVPDTV